MGNYKNVSKVIDHGVLFNEAGKDRKPGGGPCTREWGLQPLVH